MSSAFFSTLGLLVIFIMISSTVLSLQTNDELSEIFRPFRNRNVKISEKEDSKNVLAKLIGEDKKKVDCYRRGGYRTGGGGGGIPPVIIIGIPGAGGGSGGGGVPATGSGGNAGGGGVPATGSGGNAAGGSPGGDAAAGDGTTVPTA